MKHHYYGASLYGWEIGTSKEDVIKRLAKVAGPNLIKQQVKNNTGMKIVVCKVNLPAPACYTISEYLPNKILKEDGVNTSRQGEVVPISEVEELRIINSRGKTIPM